MIRKYVGVDLAAKPVKPTFISCMYFDDDRILELNMLKVKSDIEILDVINEIGPRHVSIDAPLSLNVDEKGLRPQDRCAIKRGAMLLPIKSEGMRLLGIRGERMAKLLRSNGLTVFETHPYSVARLLGYSSTRELAFLLFKRRVPKGEADSIAAGYMGYLYDIGKATECGGDPPFILPSKADEYNDDEA